jgi:molybdopterin-guanine dinucleotide biosynthesis protein A
MPDPARTKAEAPLGVVLAGGAARRFGGAKMTATLDGRPLVAHAVAALTATAGLDGIVVAARPETSLPGELEAEVWIEPGDGVRHPLAGIARALERAGRPVVVLAGDMPWVPVALLSRLAAPVADDRPVVVRGPGGPEPLLGRYPPATAAALRAGAEAGAPARGVVSALDPVWVDWPEARDLRSANRPSDLSGA